MIHFEILVKIPINRQQQILKKHKLKAQTLQDAMFFAYAREIYKGQSYLEKLSRVGYEPVIKREKIIVQPLSCPTIGIKKYQPITDYKKYANPTTLNDDEIKLALRIDYSLNNTNIELDKMKKMTFLI